MCNHKTSTKLLLLPLNFDALVSKANSNAADNEVTSGKCKAAGAPDGPAKGLNIAKTNPNKTKSKRKNADMVAKHHELEGTDPLKYSN